MAIETRLDWKTVKDLDKYYMRTQLARAGKPRPKVIGVDEVSIRKGHTYRVVVSDLERRRPIWFGGADRSEESLDGFYRELGEKKSKRIRMAVMDMWRPFRASTKKAAPQAAVVFDKFHILRHLGDALDQVRRSEYARLAGKERSYIKGQRYTLLSHKENLMRKGRRNLRKVLKANSRLNAAYVRAGVVRAAVGLREGRLGAAFLRELAGIAKVATPKALPEVCGDDRPALGRDSGLLQARE